MRRDPATSQKLTRGAVHLMNREIRTPKGEISPFPQASWRRNHNRPAGGVIITWHRRAPQSTRLFGGHAPSA